MKTRKNKKFYNFKEIHKRKRRYRATLVGWKTNTAEFRRDLNRAYRTKCKVILRKQLEGQEIEFPLFRKTLEWYY